MVKNKNGNKKRKTNDHESPIAESQTSQQGHGDTPLGKCGQCSLNFANDEYNPLKCSICSSYYHDECVRFDQDIANILRNIIKEVGWSCDQCITNARVQRSAPTEVCSSNSKIQHDVTELQRYCSDMHSDIIAIKASLSSMLNPPMPSTIRPDCNEGSSSNVQKISNIPGQQSLSYASMAAIPGQLSVATAVKPPDPNSMLRVVCKEMGEKERRKKNIIVSGLKPDNHLNDYSLFTKFCSDELLIDMSSHIVQDKCRRLGKPTAGKILPLLISFHKEDAANEILRNARCLRKSDNVYTKNNVFINPDMTETERQLAFEERVRRREVSERKQQPASRSTSSNDVVHPTHDPASSISNDPPHAGPSNISPHNSNRPDVEMTQC